MRIGNSVKNNIFNKLVNSPIRIIFLCCFITVLFFACTNNENLKLVSFRGTTMGTTYSIKLLSSDNNSVNENIQEKIDSILVVINQQMSTYIKDSELSIFNSSFDTSWYKVSAELASLIYEARSVSRESNGFYDITIGPVVNLWGFGPEAVPLSVPTESAIEKARKRTGIDKIKINKNSSKIKKIIPDLYLDLSSIAKGYGVDRISEFIEDLGIDNYMVEIGGELRTKGENNKNEFWRIGISTPLGDDLQKIVSISDMSVATSGDYMNYFEKEGVRYSHLIDPSSGKPISHNLASVTVIHKNCSVADAYATAINVMGPEVGYEFALKKKLPVFMIVRDGNKFVERMTSFFEDYVN